MPYVRWIDLESAASSVKEEMMKGGDKYINEEYQRQGEDLEQIIIQGVNININLQYPRAHTCISTGIVNIIIMYT